MTASLWVAQLVISQATAQKLSAKHQIDWRDVHDAIVWVPGLRYTWQAAAGADPDADRASFTDTAVVCGWSNPSSFIDAFSRAVGQTPGRYQATLVRELPAALRGDGA